MFDLNEPKVEPTPISMGTRTTISKVVWSKQDTNKVSLEELGPSVPLTMESGTWREGAGLQRL